MITSTAVTPTLVTPTPSDEEAAAIVAAIEAVWPKAESAPAPTTTAWRFSGRWWTK